MSSFRSGESSAYGQGVVHDTGRDEYQQFGLVVHLGRILEQVAQHGDVAEKRHFGDCVVLDTKWKNLNGYNPSPDDLRQMYVYHEYYNAKRVALIYPGLEIIKNGVYLDRASSADTDKQCSLIFLPVEKNTKTWQKNIHNKFISWIG